MQFTSTSAFLRDGSGRLPASIAVFVAVLLTAASFGLQGHVGLNLADEGFLWHGTMRVLRGDLPLRDFQSYDPGRYYWSAFWMRLGGDEGILSLRLGVVLFQACALAAALLLLRRVISGPLALLVAAFVLLLWFVPRHKMFDISMSIFAVCAGAAVIRRPSLRRHFAAGVYVGAAAFVGRNHGVYAAAAIALLTLLAWFRIDRSRPVAKLLLLATGTLAGYSPMLFLALSQPGFFDAVVEGVQLMFRMGATNLALPVPWPWAVDYHVPLPWALHRLTVGLLFLALPAFYGAALLVLVRQPGEAITRHSELVAAVVVGAVYMHYAFARAGVLHLAHALPPFLIAVFALVPAAPQRLRPWMRLGVPGALLLITLVTAGMMSPLYLIGRHGEDLDVRGNTLVVDAETAHIVRTVQEIARVRMSPGERIVFAPYWPTMYGVLRQVSPLWETYSTSLASDPQAQARMVQDFETARVEWALIGNAMLDGRDDRRFRHTHPVVWRYLEEHYLPVQIDGLPPDYRLLRRREGSADGPDRTRSSSL
jgi:hypothetical protein